MLKKEKFDVGIIGAGVAGCFAALKLQEKYKLKTIVFEIGRPWQKRRRQLEGAAGVLLSGDGKLFPRDIDKIKKIANPIRVTHAYDWVKDWLQEAGSLKLTKDTLPTAAIQTKIREHNFKLSSNDHYQWKPDVLHKFSRILANLFEDSELVKFSFDNEVHTILKKNDTFHITSNAGEFQCKRLIFCPGRTGWRWANHFYKEMGMEVNDNTARFGVRFELASQYMKDMNHSYCSLDRDDLSVGPFFWNGTIIPEDHADLVTSGFRSNEDRWHSEKVTFSLIGNISYPNGGVDQTERLANLSYLLFNDRISKEKVKVFLNKSSQLNLIPEYNWLGGAIKELNEIFPNLILRGSYHVPHISCMPGQIKLNKELCSDIPGLYIAGESANIPGIMGAAVSGAIVADSVAK